MLIDINIVIIVSTYLTPFRVAANLFLDVNAAVLLIFVDNPTNGIIFHLIFLREEDKVFRAYIERAKHIPDSN